MLAPVGSHAQTTPAGAASAPAAKPATPVRSGAGPVWSELKPAEQVALKPLQGEWSSIDEQGKRKWLKIAESYPAMSAPDQDRLHTRMTEWAKMSPQERTNVRQRYLEAKSIPSTDRQAGWEAYQALSPQERQALAARAASAPRSTAKPVEPAARRARPESLPAKSTAAATATAAKPTASTSPSAPTSPSAKPIAPTAVQGKPGATTSLITKRPTPHEQQATGSAKIAASADVVDKTTLLPRAGAQKAGAPPAPPAAPGAQSGGAHGTRAQPTAASASAMSR